MSSAGRIGGGLLSGLLRKSLKSFKFQILVRWNYFGVWGGSAFVHFVHGEMVSVWINGYLHFVRYI